MAASAKIRTFVLGSYTDKISDLVIDQEEGSMHLAVVNQVGMKLPITGSQAMLFLVVAGVFLMAVSAWRGKKRHE